VPGFDRLAGASPLPAIVAAGRLAAVTNFRELEQGPADARSRGELVVEHRRMDDASWQQREFPIGST